MFETKSISLFISAAFREDIHSNAPVSVDPQEAPQSTQGILTAHPGGYNNGISTQGQFWHLK